MLIYPNTKNWHMEMFDYIECEYELPLPEFGEEEKQDLKDIVWEEVVFQTKNFDNLMITYEITEEGQIYEHKVERELVEDETFGADVKEIKVGIEKIEHSGQIVFYTLVLGEKFDYWFEFSALFWKGELKEVNLLEYKKENNEVRLKGEENVNKLLKDFNRKQKKWWFPAYKFYRNCLRLSLGAIRWLVGWIAKITWKIERWLP